MLTIEVGSEMLVRFVPIEKFSAIDEVQGSFTDGVAVHCQPGAPPRRLADCLACHRFRGARPTENGILLRCEWTHTDPVSARMTRAPALVTVDSNLEVQAALEIARKKAVHHLPVVNGGSLMGMVCECDLVRASDGERVGDCMRPEVYAVPPNASLGEALTAMKALAIHCLLVVSSGLIVGIITSGDLRRSGAAI